MTSTSPAARTRSTSSSPPARRLDAELAGIEAEEAAKQAELDERKALLAARIREAYDTDRTLDARDVPLGRRLHRRPDRGRLPPRLRRAGQAPRRPDRPGPEGPRRPPRRTSSIARDADRRSCTPSPPSRRRSSTGSWPSSDAARKELAPARGARPQKLLEAAAGRLRADGRATRPSSQQKLQDAAARPSRSSRSSSTGSSEQSSPRAASRPSTTARSSGRCAGTDHPGVRLHRLLPGSRALGNCAHFHRGIDIAERDVHADPRRRPGQGHLRRHGARTTRPWIVVIAHSSHLVTWYGHVDNEPTAGGPGRPVRRRRARSSPTRA